MRAWRHAGQCSHTAAKARSRLLAVGEVIKRRALSFLRVPPKAISGQTVVPGYRTESAPPHVSGALSPVMAPEPVPPGDAEWVSGVTGPSATGARPIELFIAVLFVGFVKRERSVPLYAVFAVEHPAFTNSDTPSAIMEILNFMKTIVAERCHYSSFFYFFSTFFAPPTLTSSPARSSNPTRPTNPFPPSMTAASVTRAALIFFMML